MDKNVKSKMDKKAEEEPDWWHGSACACINVLPLDSVESAKMLNGKEVMHQFLGKCIAKQHPILHDAVILRPKSK